MLKKRKVPSDIDNILFIKLGAIGDVLMTTPLIRAIKKRYPNAQITYYCGKSYSKVLSGNTNINRLVPFDQDIFFKKQIKSIIKLKNKIKKEKYDIAFVLDKHWSLSLFAFLCKIPFRIGFDRNGEGFANNMNISYKKVRHEIDYYLDLAKLIGIKSSTKKIDLTLDKKETNYAKDIFKKNKIKKSICLIPGGANNPGVGDDPIRRWPEAKFAELIQKAESKYSIILLGGPGDVAIGKKILSALNNDSKKHIINLIGKTSIKESAAIMKNSNHIVCNDSGPMHIASAVNNKIISLFGPSSPKRKAPLNKGAVAIWKSSSMYDERYELYGKKPKYKDYMGKIKVKDVLSLIR